MDNDFSANQNTDLIHCCMKSNLKILCLHRLPPYWFKIMFDQNEGNDKGQERFNSYTTVCYIANALAKETRLICPQPIEAIWKWAELLCPNDVKVVLLGQCPYSSVFRQNRNNNSTDAQLQQHNSTNAITMADGLAFNVNHLYCSLEKKLPKSLVNIMRSVDKSFNERLSDDTVFCGDNLTSWAEDDSTQKSNNSQAFYGSALASWTKDGVLPLNVALTTVEGYSNAHADIGWDKITDRIVLWFGRKKEESNNNGTWKPRVFILLGENAKKKSKLIDQRSHVVLTASDPDDPLFYRGEGKDIFRKANFYLRLLGYSSVRWSCRK